MKKIFESGFVMTQKYGNDFYYHFVEKKICKSHSGCNVKDCHQYYKYRYNLAGHNGLDLIPIRSNDFNIHAFLGGIVLWKGFDNSYGNRVVLWNQESGLIETFSHLSFINPEIQKNKSIQEYQVVGVMGNTGQSFREHLHYQIAEIDKNGNRKNYNNGNYGWIDPILYIT